MLASIKLTCSLSLGRLILHVVSWVLSKAIRSLQCKYLLFYFDVIVL